MENVVFESFEKETLPNRIVNSLLTLITEKQLQPGDKLPPERELALMMRVGRPSLRSALRALEVMNVIEIRPGAGAYVSSLQPDKLVEHLEFVFSLDHSSILQLFDARTTLEVRTAMLAAKYADDKQLAKLEGTWQHMRDLFQMAGHGAVDELESLDREFHKGIAAAANNPILWRFVAVVNQMAVDSRRQAMRMPGAIEATLAEHRVILDALLTHRPEAAREAMLAHLRQAERHLRRLLLSPSSSEPFIPPTTAIQPGTSAAHSDKEISLSS